LSQCIRAYSEIELEEKIHHKGYVAYQTQKHIFDLEKYSKVYPYGKLSGKVIEDLIIPRAGIKGPG
jgi:hypothetical protein